MPWREMVAICREEGALSIIDAAHSLGQELNINLGDTQPDFWVANCSKWFYAKRGSALLYVPKRNQHLIPYSIPAGIVEPGKGIMSDFATEFVWNGSADVAIPLTIDSALDFRAAVGGEEKIIRYCQELAVTGGTKLAAILNTEVMSTDASPETRICMVNVRLPFSAPVAPSFGVFSGFDRKLIEDHKVYASVFYHDGKWWIRVSAQIYNEISDFERLGAALLVACAEIEKEFGAAQPPAS
ncbi:hypothetical protein AAF712_007381 [Marasmius tenuissimus]|uniref:Aminotransferase class V domain-containing protein n=1 Tax=Marasmius tenuissimus TaxID=585030 RepID=A0ABR2ZW17_9AGAR|nr:hypothetical protein PM082_019967 [Marasmius tenuissimus]